MAHFLSPFVQFFKDTIHLVLEQVQALSTPAKDMLTQREVLCTTAKALISKEIEATQKSFDLEKIMDEMEEQNFIEFGTPLNRV